MSTAARPLVQAKRTFLASYGGRFDDGAPAGWAADRREGQWVVTLPNRQELTFTRAPQWEGDFPVDTGSTRLWCNSLRYLLDLVELPDGGHGVVNLLRSFEGHVATMVSEPARFASGSLDHQVALQLRTLCSLRAREAASEVPDEQLDAVMCRLVPQLVAFVEAAGLLTESNHGIMLAIALLHAAAMFEFDGGDGVTRRADAFLRSAFTAIIDDEGVANENSPMYQAFYVRLTEQCGSFFAWAHPHEEGASFYVALSERVLDAFRHMLMPDGSVPPIGDGSRSYQSTHKPLFGELVSVENGLYVHSSPATFFSLVCGHRGIIHKQLDDTSITLAHAGSTLVTDAGLLSYDNNDALARSIRSQRGHSGVFFVDEDALDPAKVINFTDRTRRINGRFEPSASAVSGRTDLACTVRTPLGLLTRRIRWLDPESFEIFDAAQPDSAPRSAVTRFQLEPAAKHTRMDADHLLVRHDKAWAVFCHHRQATSLRTFRGFVGDASRPAKGFVATRNYVCDDATLLEWTFPATDSGGLRTRLTFGAASTEPLCRPCTADRSEGAEGLALESEGAPMLRVAWLASHGPVEVDLLAAGVPRAEGRYLEGSLLTAGEEAATPVSRLRCGPFLFDLTREPRPGGPEHDASHRYLGRHVNRTPLRVRLTPLDGVELHRRGRLVEVLRDNRKVGELHLQPEATGAVPQWSASGGELSLTLPSAARHAGRLAWRTTDFLVTERSTALLPALEKHGERPVRFLVDASAQPDQRLVFVFTTMSRPGDFSYNYRRPFQDAPFTRVFVLDDFREQGCYYLCEERDFGIFDDVQAFLRHHCAQVGVEPAEVMFVGTSKGGSAALAHGLTLGAGRIVVGAPQWRIGSFLKEPHPGVCEYMTGGVEASDIAWLDGQLARLARESSFAGRVEVLVGEADHHLASHVQPLANDLREAGVDVQVVRGLGTPHRDIGPVFSAWVQQVATEHTEEGHPPAWVSQDGGKLRLSMSRRPGEITAVRLVQGRDEVDMRAYSHADQWEWSGLPSGRYGFRVYLRVADEGSPYKVFGIPPFNYQA